jgi:hypothetical protein
MLHYLCAFLGTFAKLRKATVNCVMSVCPSVCRSVCPRGTTHLPLGGFLRHLTFELSLKIRRENSSFHYNPTRITGTLHEGVSTFLTISCSILLRIRNDVDNTCRENQNTHFVFNYFFPKIAPFMR